MCGHLQSVRVTIEMSLIYEQHFGKYSKMAKFLLVNTTTQSCWVESKEERGKCDMLVVWRVFTVNTKGFLNHTNAHLQCGIWCVIVGNCHLQKDLLLETSFLDCIRLETNSLLKKRQCSEGSVLLKICLLMWARCIPELQKIILLLITTTNLCTLHSYLFN